MPRACSMTSAFFRGALVTAHFLIPRSSIHCIQAFSPFTMGSPLSSASHTAGFRAVASKPCRSHGSTASMPSAPPPWAVPCPLQDTLQASLVRSCSAGFPSSVLHAPIVAQRDGVLEVSTGEARASRLSVLHDR